MAVIPREEPATLLTVCEQRLRQAHADVRLPDQEPRRQGRHHHQDHRAQRQGGRPAPGHRRRRPDADHRRRQADPHAGRRHPDHRPQHAGRAPDPPRGGGTEARRSSRWSASPRRKRASARSRPRWPPRAPRQQAEPLAEEDLGDESDADEDEGRGGSDEDDGARAATERSRRASARSDSQVRSRWPRTPATSARAPSSLFERAQALFPGGVNSPVRAFKAVGGTPVFIERGVGRVRLRRRRQPLPRLRRVVGPADPRATPIPTWSPPSSTPPSQGTTFGAPTAREVEFGELVRFMMPSMEKMRLVSSGHRGDDVGAARGARLHRAAAASSRSTAATTATPTCCWPRPARAW